jgi:hypothetical protein
MKNLFNPTFNTDLVASAKKVMSETPSLEEQETAKAEDHKPVIDEKKMTDIASCMDRMSKPSILYRTRQEVKGGTFGLMAEEEQIDEISQSDAVAAEIRDAFDTNPNLTVSQLARRYGMSTSQVKKILMSEECDDSMKKKAKTDKDQVDVSDEDMVDTSPSDKKTSSKKGNVQELSKKTLGNYIKKASFDKAKNAYNWGREKKYDDPSNDFAANVKRAPKDKRRSKGIEMATNKLTREASNDARAQVMDKQNREKSRVGSRIASKYIKNIKKMNAKKETE